MQIRSELSSARQLLLQSRSVIAEVAGKGAIGYQDRTDQEDRHRGSFYPNPRTFPYTVAHTRDFEIPIVEEQVLEGYNGVRVLHTSAYSVDHPWSVPAVTHDVSIVVKRLEGQQVSDTHLRVDTNGNANFYTVVNAVPQRKQKGTPRDEQIMNLRTRTAEGLIVASFTAAALNKIHGIQSDPNGRLAEVEEKLKEKVAFEEIPLQPGIAILLPQKAQAITG